jgi:hypothetical protein
VNGIGIKTQSFGRIADPFIWNFLLEKDIDDEDKASPSLSTSLSSVSSTSPSSSTTTTRTTSSSSSFPPAPANKKRKLNEGASNVDVSSNADYPHLLRALGKEEDGFNPADPTIQKIMRGLLAEIIDLLSKDYELNMIDSLLIIVYHTFACPKLPAIDPSKIQKNGSILPSKLPGQNKKAPTKPHTASATTYSASTETPFLPPVRLKEYLYQNQCPQCNSLQ